MSSKPPDPSDLTKKIASFLEIYGTNLNYHANFLGAIGGLVRENETIAEVNPSNPSVYENQANQLRDLLSKLQKATTGTPLVIETLEDRINLQDQFSKVINTLNMMIDEHKTLGTKAHRGSSEKRLEKRFRRNKFMADDEPLDDSMQKRIKRRAKSNRAEAADMTEEVIKLSDARDALNEIRLDVFHNGRGTDASGQGHGLQ